MTPINVQWSWSQLTVEESPWVVLWDGLLWTGPLLTGVLGNICICDEFAFLSLREQSLKCWFFDGLVTFGLPNWIMCLIFRLLCFNDTFGILSILSVRWGHHLEIFPSLCSPNHLSWVSVDKWLWSSDASLRYSPSWSNNRCIAGCVLGHCPWWKTNTKVKPDGITRRCYGSHAD